METEREETKLGLLDFMKPKKAVKQDYDIDEMEDVGDPDKKLIDFLYKTLLPESKKFDEPFKKNRNDNTKMYKGDQWRRKQPQYKSKSVTNFLSLIVRDECAILTDNLADAEVFPVDEDANQQTADILRKLVDHVNYKNDAQPLWQQAVKLQEIQGVSYVYPKWNPLLSDGDGDIELEILKADNVRRDPSGEDNFFSINKKVSMAEIYRLYPDKADIIRAEKVDSKYYAQPDRQKNPTMPVQSTDGSETVQYEVDTGDVIKQYDKVELDTWWLRDSSTEDIIDESAKSDEDDINATSDGSDQPKTNLEEDMTAPNEKTEKYPHGRWVIVANQKTILKDFPCKVRHFPLVPAILDTDPETDVNGIAVLDYIKQQQVDFNELHALAKDYVRAVTYPRFTYDPRSGIDPKKIKNSWGAGIPGNSQQFGWASSPSLPGDVFTMMKTEKDNIEYVSALTDISQGRRPSSVQSAEALKILQEASRTVLRPKARLLESCMKKVNILIIDLIQAGYTTERAINIVVGGKTQTVQINTMQIKDGVTTVLNDVTVGEYDVRIVPDSTMPHSEIEKFDKLMELAKAGFVDRKSVLRHSGLDDWEEIEARMQQKEQQAQQQQAQQQQMEMQAKGQKEPNMSINYSDLNTQGRAQMAAKVGINIGLNPQEGQQPPQMAGNQPQGLPPQQQT